MTAPLGALLETTRSYTLLGIRFYDVVTDLAVEDGLRVQAVHIGGRYPPVPARRSPSGVYAFHDLPTLRDVQYPSVEIDAATLVPRSDFVITVEDARQRFVPCAMVVRLPLPYRGLFLSATTASLPGAEGRAYLFPAATRTAVAGVASIRADVWDRTRWAPAAFAAVRADVAGRTYTGIADEQGHVQVMFPYPTLEQLRLGSPPGTGQRAADTEWPMRLRVAYPPTGTPPLAAVPADLLEPAWRRMPSLKQILTAPDEIVWPTSGGPSAAFIDASLRFGVELTVRTAQARRLHVRALGAATSLPEEDAPNA